MAARIEARACPAATWVPARLRLRNPGGTRISLRELGKGLPNSFAQCGLLARGVLAFALTLAPAHAAEKVVLSSVGSSSTNLWPTVVAVNKSLFAAEDLQPDLVFAPSNAAVIQQLAAGSVDVAVNAGLVDPIRAIEKGAAAALVRIEVRAPPYSLLSRPAITSMQALRGKVISVGGAKDITRIFVERMLSSANVRPGDFDMVFAGATSARFSALASGAVDAAILAPPFNFHAEAAGFTNLGMTVDYAPDLPFAGMVVNRSWAAANRRTMDKVLAVYRRSMDWLYDPSHRGEAVSIMVEVSKMQAADVERAYDFLIGRKLFEPSGKVSRAQLAALVRALQELVMFRAASISRASRFPG
jgi:ABC-type nitrate/sulfonate/bicarbonate transport system substrate-binding protein